MRFRTTDFLRGQTLFFVLVILIGTQDFSFAQQTSWSNNIPKMVSPQAYEFTKYGDIPVSNYTGVPNIEVPIYSLSAAGLEIPISLSYHSNGIKVNEEASWVGLGWTLIPGGTIIQVVNEYDDFGSPYLDYSNVSIPGGTSGCDGTVVDYSLENDLTLEREFVLDLYDSEPDNFMFNMLGYSGEFYFDKQTKTFLSLTDSNIKITSDLTPTSSTAPNHFIVTVPDGHKFVFGARSSTVINSSYGYNAPGGGTTPPVDLIGRSSSRSYHLMKIFTSKGEEINFEYVTTSPSKNYPSISKSFVQNVWLDERVSLGRYPGPRMDEIFPPTRSSMNFTSTSQPFVYLKSIWSDKVKIEFNTSNDRLDLIGASRLNEIIIRNNANDDTIVKRFVLAYDYFQSSPGGNTIDSYLEELNVVKTADEKRLRLKLQSLKEVNDEPYTFEYSDILLPEKTSLAYDHWGFYNGLKQSTLLTRSGANDPFVQAGILESITYPMGGKSVFHYESNTTSDTPQKVPRYNQESGKVTMTDKNYTTAENNTYGINVYRTGPNSYWLMVPERAEVAIHPILSLEGTCSSNPNGDPELPNAVWEIRHYNAAAKSLVEDNGWSSIPSFVSNPNFLKYIQTGKIKAGEALFKDWGRTTGFYQAGVYFFSATLNDNCGPQNTVGQHGMAWLMFEYDMQVDKMETKIPVGGGLRVKSIQDFDELSAIVKTQTFTYADPKLMSHPEYMSSMPFRYEYNMHEDGSGPCDDICCFSIGGTTITKSSNSVFAPSTNASGKFVGYGRVEVKHVDLQNTSNGKKVTIFQNQPDQPSQYANLPALRPTRKNGLVLKEWFEDIAGNKIRADSNTYVDVISPCLIGVKNWWHSRIAEECFGTISSTRSRYENTYRLGFYPIKRTQTLLSSTITISYEGGKALRSRQSFQYDDRNQVAKKIFVDSQGNLNETVYKYPYDLPEGSQMLANNFFSIPLETEKLTNGNLTYFEKNIFKIIDSSVLYGEKDYFDLESASSKFAVNSPLKTQIRFDLYDKDKVLQYVTKEGVLTSIVWGYDKQYVVAVVSGASYSEVMQFVNTTILNSPSDDLSLRQELNKIRIGLPSAFVTTYTHVPLVGVSSITDSNGNTQFFTFDEMQRLETIKDNGSNIINFYQYNTFKK